MATIDKSEIKRISKLANLDLSPKEVEELTPQLAEIVDFFETLNEVDTKNIEPTSQTTGLVNKTRADQINSTRILNSKEALLNASKRHNEYFMVDALLDKNNE